MSFTDSDVNFQTRWKKKKNSRQNIIYFYYISDKTNYDLILEWG